MHQDGRYVDASTLEFLEKHPEVDKAVCAAVRLARDTLQRDGRGEAGIKLIFNNNKTISHREVTDLIFKTQ